MVGGDTSLHDWRRSVSRALRRRVRALVRLRWPEEDLVLPVVDEVGNPYDGPRDGTGWYEPYRVTVEWRAAHGAHSSRFAHYRAVLMK
jgi:hypothetical protein